MSGLSKELKKDDQAAYAQLMDRYRGSYLLYAAKKW